MDLFVKKLHFSVGEIYSIYIYILLNSSIHGKLPAAWQRRVQKGLRSQVRLVTLYFCILLFPILAPPLPQSCNLEIKSERVDVNIEIRGIIIKIQQDPCAEHM